MRSIWLALGVVVGSACSPPAPVAESAAPAVPPATPVRLAIEGAQNRMPSLAANGNRVVAVWTATRDDAMNIYAATSEDGGASFSSPRRVNDKAGDVSSNAEQPPRVAMVASEITVIWPSRLDGPSVIRMARSHDGGQTFAPAETIHKAGLTGLRGWESVAVGQDGAIHAVWLDGRHATPASGGHHHHAQGATSAKRAAPRQDVYQAVIERSGRVTETHVNRDVCFCCKTAVAVGPGGRVNVAWRHIFANSMRDIAMATSSDGGRTFDPLVRVSEDNWQLSGCPDDGPAIAVGRNDVVHLSWPTLLNATGEAPQKAIFYSSTSDGKTFAPRLKLTSEETEDAGHPQMAVNGTGHVAAAWDEQNGDRRTVVLRVSPGADRTFNPPQVVNADGSGFHPFVAGLDEGFVVSWAESGGGQSVIRVARYGLP
jgi:hypothetical protein